MRLLQSPLLLLLSSPALSAVVPTITPTPVSAAAHHINKREDWPASVAALIPKEVDPRFFSVDGNGNTQALPSATDHFSTVEVSVSKREDIGSKTATAAVGIYTATSEKDGENPVLSFQVAPAVLEKIKNAANSAAARVRRSLEESGDVEHHLQKREMLPPFDPKLFPVAQPIADIINAEAGPSLIGVEMAGEPLAVVAAEGALPAGAAGSVALGFAVVPYVAFVSWMAWTWAGMVVALNSSPQLNLPHSVVIDAKQLPNQGDCQGAKPSCKADSCKGDLFICSIDPHCPCEDKPATCNDDEELTDCAKCTEVDGKCTTGDKAGCDCTHIQDIVSDDRIDDAPGFYKFMNDAWTAWWQLPFDDTLPSKDPACATVDLSGVRPPALLSTQSTQKRPKDIMYMIRETLCNNKCETPADLPPKSVKTAKKNDQGCEVSVLLSSLVELYGVRDTASTGDEWQDCWDSFANITEKATCTDFNPNAVGWVNGPDDHEFFQMGYRPKNGDGKLHDDFADGDELAQFCGNEKPTCDTCVGGASRNTCTQGDFSGCACEAVTATQPNVPKATNCATAVAAAEIVCCGWSKDTQKTCANKMQGCGVIVDLDAQCQSPVAADGSGTYQVCGQFQKGDPILRGSNMADIAECMVKEFTLDADLQYQS